MKTLPNFKGFSNSLLFEVQEKSVCHVHAGLLNYYFVDDNSFKIQMGDGKTREDKLKQFCEDQGLIMIAIPEFMSKGIVSFLKKVEIAE